MPNTKVIVKKEFYPILAIGDKATIIPIVYEKDTLVINEQYGLINPNTNKLVMMCSESYPNAVKVADAVYTPKGSYKGSVVELEDGSQYPGTYFRNYVDYFDKVI